MFALAMGASARGSRAHLPETRGVDERVDDSKERWRFCQAKAV
jgi:hypothetical protein